MGIIKPLLTDDDRYLLCFEDFDRVFRIVQKHAIMRLEIYLERETEKRCNLLKSPDTNNFGDLSEEYKKMALSAQQLEIQVYETVMQTICDRTSIDKQLFLESQYEILQDEVNR